MSSCWRPRRNLQGVSRKSWRKSSAYSSSSLSQPGSPSDASRSSSASTRRRCRASSTIPSFSKKMSLVAAASITAVVAGRGWLHAPTRCQRRVSSCWRPRRNLQGVSCKSWKRARRTLPPHSRSQDPPQTPQAAPPPPRAGDAGRHPPFHPSRRRRCLSWQWPALQQLSPGGGVTCSHAMSAPRELMLAPSPQPARGLAQVLEEELGVLFLLTLAARIPLRRLTQLLRLHAQATQGVIHHSILLEEEDVFGGSGQHYSCRRAGVVTCSHAMSAPRELMLAPLPQSARGLVQVLEEELGVLFLLTLAPQTPLTQLLRLHVQALQGIIHHSILLEEDVFGGSGQHHSSRRAGVVTCSHAMSAPRELMLALSPQSARGLVQVLEEELGVLFLLTLAARIPLRRLTQLLRLHVQATQGVIHHSILLEEEDVFHGSGQHYSSCRRAGVLHAPTRCQRRVSSCWRPRRNLQGVSCKSWRKSSAYSSSSLSQPGSPSDASRSSSASTCRRCRASSTIPSFSKKKMSLVAAASITAVVAGRGWLHAPTRCQRRVSSCWRPRRNLQGVSCKSWRKSSAYSSSSLSQPGSPSDASRSSSASTCRRCRASSTIPSFSKKKMSLVAAASITAVAGRGGWRCGGRAWLGAGGWSGGCCSRT